jgi:hypothetical protein
MAPCRRDSTPNSQWCQTEYHQEYTPVAELEAALQSLVCHGQLDDNNAETIERLISIH